MLAAVLCVWLLAAATHFHTDDQDSHHNRNVSHLCGFCGSLSSGGAAASGITFSPIVGPDAPFLIPADTQPPSLRLIVSHRSRAPPVA